MTKLDKQQNQRVMSITHCWKLFTYNHMLDEKITFHLSSIKAKFRYAVWSHTDSKLVADLQRAEIWPII